MSSGHPLESSEASVARVAVENHPLAAGAMTTTSPPRSQINYQHFNTGMATASVGAVASPPPPLNHYPTNSATATTITLDELADEFLSSKPPPVSLRPSPLPRGQVGIVRLRTLVERRAWGDVLKLASTLLEIDNDGSSSSRKKSPSSSSKNKQYPKVYASLLFGAQDDSVVAENVSHNVRQETVEILMLRCNALLKLRRYTDLSKEVEQWNFLKQNDVTAPLIEWIPWGLRKSRHGLPSTISLH
jgi:hypothetical protein